MLLYATARTVKVWAVISTRGFASRLDPSRLIALRALVIIHMLQLQADTRATPCSQPLYTQQQRDSWHRQRHRHSSAQQRFLANVNSSSRSPYGIARPSFVVCLSSVTFVRPTQAVQIFANISTALGTLAIR